MVAGTSRALQPRCPAARGWAEGGAAARGSGSRRLPHPLLLAGVHAGQTPPTLKARRGPGEDGAGSPITVLIVVLAYFCWEGRGEPEGITAKVTYSHSCTHMLSHYTHSHNTHTYTQPSHSLTGHTSLLQLSPALSTVFQEGCSISVFSETAPFACITHAFLENSLCSHNFELFSCRVVKITFLKFWFL